MSWPIVWKGGMAGLAVAAILFAGMLWLLTSLVIDFAPGTRKTPQEFARIAGTVRGPLEKLELTSGDGVKVSAWYLPATVPQGADRWGVILVHGRGDDKTYYLELGENLRDKGFDVVLPDLRGGGESDPSPDGMTLGITEARDVAAAAEFLAERKKVGKIAAVGVSMGGVASVMGASLEPRIGPLIVESSSFRAERVFDFMLAQFRLSEGRVRSALAGLTNRVGIWRMGGDWSDIRAGVLPNWRLARDLAPRPVLFIYGDEDPLVRKEDIALFRQRFAGPTRVLVSRKTGHGVYRPHQAAYTRAATQFLEDWRAGRAHFSARSGPVKDRPQEDLGGV